MLKELEKKIKALLKKRWEESEYTEEITRPLVDKIPDLCISCSKCYFTSEGEICSGECKWN